MFSPNILFHPDVYGRKMLRFLRIYFGVDLIVLKGLIRNFELVYINPSMSIVYSLHFTKTLKNEI